MKRLRFRLVLILAAVINPLLSLAQYDIGLKASYGLSQVNIQESKDITDLAVFFHPSGQGGLFYNFYLKNNFTIGAELLFVQIEGEQHYSQKVHGHSYWSDIDYRQHISCIGIPVYVGYNWKWFNFNLGFQTNIVLISSGKRTETNLPISWEYDIASLPIEFYDFGFRPGLLAKVSDKLSFDMNYYFGFRNIYSDPEIYDWKVQQFTIGLRYILVSLNNE